MKSPWHFMTCGDLWIVSLLLISSLAGIAWVAAMPEGSRVVVTGGEKLIFTAPLGVSHTVALDGPLGQTHLVVDHKGVKITDSPCPRKICLSMGSISQTGDLLACVPNHILVRIEGPAVEEASYDLLSR